MGHWHAPWRDRLAAHSLDAHPPPAAGQERFRTLTSSYYRGAQGLVFVYDITRPESFANLREVWLREVEMYATLPDAVKLVIGNKLDRESERAVSRADGVAFARQHGALFLEVSAKSSVGVQEAFAELVQRVAESPALLSGTGGGRLPAQATRGGSVCC
jgi:Ras-related protein Rab-18